MPRRPPRALLALAAAALAALSITAAVAAGHPAPVTLPAGGLPYQDPSLPVADRVHDLMSRMTLDDELGQMTQAERAALNPQSDLATYRVGSVLSGGGSAPSPNTAQSWADMYDNFQRIALSTPLGIPMIYGADAVHGHNNVYGATIFPHNIGLGATRDPALVQRIGRATAEEVVRHRHRLGLRALPVRGPRRPLGPHLRVVRRECRSIPTAMTSDHHRPAGRHAGRPRVGAGDRQALRRRRRHHRRRQRGQHPDCPKRTCGPSTCRRSRRRSTAASAR